MDANRSQHGRDNPRLIKRVKRRSDQRQPHQKINNEEESDQKHKKYENKREKNNDSKKEKDEKSSTKKTLKGTFSSKKFSTTGDSKTTSGRQKSGKDYLYAIKDINSWNKPSNFCKKQLQFYHQKKQAKDEARELQQKRFLDKLNRKEFLHQKIKIQKNRFNSKRRMQERKMERVALQRQSAQYIAGNEFRQFLTRISGMSSEQKNRLVFSKSSVLHHEKIFASKTRRLDFSKKRKSLSEFHQMKKRGMIELRGLLAIREAYKIKSSRLEGEGVSTERDEGTRLIRFSKEDSKTDRIDSSGNLREEGNGKTSKRVRENDGKGKKIHILEKKKGILQNRQQDPPKKQFSKAIEGFLDQEVNLMTQNQNRSQRMKEYFKKRRSMHPRAVRRSNSPMITFKNSRNSLVMTGAIKANPAPKQIRMAKTGGLEKPGVDRSPVSGYLGVRSSKLSRSLMGSRAGFDEVIEKPGKIRSRQRSLAMRQSAAFETDGISSISDRRTGRNKEVGVTDRSPILMERALLENYEQKRGSVRVYSKFKKSALKGKNQKNAFTDGLNQEGGGKRRSQVRVRSRRNSRRRSGARFSQSENNILLEEDQVLAFDSRGKGIPVNAHLTSLMDKGSLNVSRSKDGGKRTEMTIGLNMSSRRGNRSGLEMNDSGKADFISLLHHGRNTKSFRSCDPKWQKDHKKRQISPFVKGYVSKKVYDSENAEPYVKDIPKNLKTIVERECIPKMSVSKNEDEKTRLELLFPLVFHPF